ncbi:MAG: helix-turn-helix transcriptional regulator [Oscillospiraceae bacterium]|nr:helix-turn-helix transcriptional regulator [Oscillospiraceae bacterium]
MTLSEIISDYRNKHGLSQRKFAEMCGVSNGYISMLEKGSNPKTGKAIVPALDRLQRIAKVMGMTVDELLTLADEIEVDISKRPALDGENGPVDDLDLEIASLVMSMSQAKKKEALGFLRYLASREDN